MEKKDPNKKPIQGNEEEGAEGLSGEEILNRIENGADNMEDIENHPEDEREEGSEFMSKLGLSKKDKLKKENAELKQKLAELNDKYLRLNAEFDNFKKRNLRERIEFSKTAAMDVVAALLPVLDDFSRAIKQMETSPNIDALKEGVKLIQQKLTGILESKGLKQMKSAGEEFNPEFHDAISEIPVNDDAMKGKVVEEIEPGYYLNDKIIRHAKVVVGK